MARHSTVEQTKKSIKAQSLLAFLTAALGVGLIALSSNSGTETDNQATMAVGVLTMIGGAVWMMGMRVAKWWHHD